MISLQLNKPLCFFDLETTGVNIGVDRIVEISIVKIMPSEEQIIYTKRINPTISIPSEASAIHGIYDIDVKQAPKFAELAAEIIEFIGDSDLGGYNVVNFDVPLLAEEFLRAEMDFDLKNRKLLDAQTIFHKMEPRTLSAAYKFYCGKKLDNAHSAEADTLATCEIFKAQLQRYENEPYEDKQGNISYPVVNDIDKLSEFCYTRKSADLAGFIGIDELGREFFTFGKHKGKSVVDILLVEPSYYEWIMKAEFPLYTKKILKEIKQKKL